MAEKQPTFRGELIKLIVRVQPNIKYKELERFVSELSIHTAELAMLQAQEEADDGADVSE